MELSAVQCPHCQSSNVRLNQTYKTKQNGQRELFKCRDCKRTYSETINTPAEGLKTSLSRIAEILNVRSEGMAFNACCRAFKIGKSTLSNWEKRFSKLKNVLFLYSLCHQFLEQIIEGDELYTKVFQNKNPKDSEGWTIVLMERVTRFLWHMECGKPDKHLFKSAISTLEKVINQTQSTSLITDGERRYGNLLFEICSETVKTGKRGRPKKRLKKVLV